MRIDADAIGRRRYPGDAVSTSSPPSGRLDPASSPYLDALRVRPVIFDGATGTNLQLQELGPDDFGGSELEGCNEILVLSKPSAVEQLHRSFLDVGVEVVETDTFGAFSVVLAEYGIADRAFELNLAGARLARRIADEYSTPERPRWVAGSMGPGTKFPTLGQIPYAQLRDAYEVQARGLLEGGVDLLLVETVFDLLSGKAAVNACKQAMAATGRRVPLQVQVTIELTGRMLPGTEIAAALTTLDAMQVDVIGLNCATGPAEMGEALRHLAAHSRVPISSLPNAGLPSVVDGKMHYDLTPDDLAEHLHRFVTELGVTAIGGCCGTTPAHLAAVVDACATAVPAVRHPVREPGAASIYTAVPFRQDTSFLVVGERTNANGSKKFREAMLAQDWDTCVAMARDQVREGAHLIDVCVDYTGADGVADMTEIASRFATQSSVPLMVDSTEGPVARAALEWLGGRPVLNSVNLEEGDGIGTRLDTFLSLAREFGAAVVCTCIDQEGQARTSEWKLRAAQAIHDIATTRYGLEPEDLLFDPLALPLSTGMEESRRDGIETIEGIRRIKSELPGVSTLLGLSNVSFGLNPAARQVLNSVFLHECVEAGLDAAIVHASKILPLSRIDDQARQVCLDLVYDRRRDGYDPLQELLGLFEGVKGPAAVQSDHADWPVEKRLEQRIIDGNRTGLEEDLDAALGAGYPALTIVNDFLLAGMKIVGDLFGSGEMQLPFVLQSAETMKAAVAYLEPHMERSDQGGKAKVVLATVKGDVHDIGKNLVDIIFTNNGYDVVNLGIKVGVSEMIAAAEEHQADVLGMSGLLVKSTLVMRENLEELNDRGLSHIPVLLGGAALTRTYVERDLRQVYQGRVFYGRDAFEGLHTMDRLVAIQRGDEEDDPEFGRAISERRVPRRSRLDPDVSAVEGQPDRSPDVVTDNPLVVPPFVGSRVAKGIPLDEIAAYVNQTALFRNQWGFRPEPGEDDKAFKSRVSGVLRQELAKAKERDLLVPQVVYGHFAVNSDGNDLIVFKDESRQSEWMRFTFPRQRKEPWLCISDFFRSVDSGDPDFASFMLVTMGERVSAETARLFQAGEYQDYLFLHGLGVELAEALAEYWHHRIREELGIAGEDGPSLTGLFRQQYRGGRYSWGYPACPELADNAKVVELLDAIRIGVTISDGFQLEPEQTTDAIVCHHPQAKYFVV
jgi:5-methyltetrahydrofolate--homocysteine methyltransferase